MPRLERDTEYWDITHDGKRLVIVTGTIGHRGKETVRTFVSPEHARVQYEKLIEGKLADGHVHVESRTDDTAPADPGDPRNPELERAIEQDPYDEAAYSVYGDWLQRQGDPRGELIALQLAEEARPDDRRLREASRRYLASHRALVEGLDKHVNTNPKLQGLEETGLVWRFGFIHRLHLDREDGGDADLAATIDDVLAHPSGRFVTEIWMREPSEQVLAEALALLGRIAPATLRELSVLGRRVGAIPAFPRLRRLVAKACLPDGELTAACLRSVASGPATLEAIELRCDGREDFDALAPLFARGDLALRELRVRGSSFAANVCRTLVGSPLAARLVKLELGMSTIDTPSAELLVTHRDRFPALREIGIARDLVSPRVVNALRAAYQRLVDVRADPDDLAGEDGDYYDEIVE